MVFFMSDDGSIPLQILSAADTTGGGSLALQIFLIIFLTFLNAFFASSEIALLSVNDTKLKKEAENGDKKAALLLKIVENPSRFLSTIQVGVTFSAFLNSAVASSSFADIITNALASSWQFAAEHRSLISTISIVVITILLSFLTLVFGELVPKRYAMKYSERVARLAIGPLRGTGFIFAPFIKLVTWSVNGVLRMIGINPNDDGENVTEEEILLMVNEGQEKGVIGDDESEMINNIFEFGDKTAMDVMTHRTEIVAISINDTFEHVIDMAAKERYSRFPVYDGSVDNIIGIIHIKDLLKVNQDTFNLNAIMRAPAFIPESQKIDDVFNVLKDNKTHMTIVVDEYGGTSGIVTMEDILEELVGNIRDEYDGAEEIENTIQKVEEDTYVVDGLMEIDDINDELELDIPSEDYDTISGLVIALLGSIPEEGEHPEVDYKNYTFTVLASNEKIIKTVKIKVGEIIEPEDVKKSTVESESKGSKSSRESRDSQNLDRNDNSQKK